MQDLHPETIELEIERDKLCRHIRLNSMRAWAISMGILALCPGVMWLIFGWLESDYPIWKLLRTTAIITLIVETAALLLAVILYYIISHWRIGIWASNLRVMVEGPFLRVIHGFAFKKTDRKIHFRALVDYVTLEDPSLRRAGLKNLVISKTDGYQLYIHGLKDCDKVRDLLAEIDAAREDPPKHRPVDE